MLTAELTCDQSISPTRITMEQYDEFDTFEKKESGPTRVDNWPSIEKIERRFAEAAPKNR